MKAVDISDTPELVRLAEEVRASGEPRVLRHDGQDVAVLTPIGARKHRPRRLNRAADDAVFLSSAGGWKDNVDVGKFLADNYQSRSLSSRPPVDL
jgi:hypothetical protein